MADLFNSVSVRARASVVWMSFWIIAVLLAYETAQLVLAKEVIGVAAVAAAVFAAAVLVAIVTDWKRGLYIFIVWLCFEDMIRKYLGNSIILFFAKDVVIGLVYVFFVVALRRRRVTLFRPPFMAAVLVFVWLGLIQVFNPNSPTLAFGAMGLKLYFYYIPLIFVGYAFLDSEMQLRRFLTVTLLIIIAISLLGVAQSIIGPTFLNPQTLQADLQELGTLYRVAPISGLEAYRPTSVFVSSGRFENFLVLGWLIAMGAVGYFLQSQRKGRLLALTALISVFAGSLMCASRGVFVWTFLNTAVFLVAFLWGAGLRSAITARVLRALQRVAIGGAIAFVLLTVLYPNAIAARLAIYSETLSVESPAYELTTRVRDYPQQEFLRAFQYPHWALGYGIGTTSLGTQYVARYFGGVRPASVESGFGTLVLEFGIAGLALWLVMAAAVLKSSWRVVRKLRASRFFPLAFCFFWFGLLVFLPLTYGGMAAYQDYLNNSYLWLFTGMLFRLPQFVAAQLGRGSTLAPPLGAT